MIKTNSKQPRTTIDEGLEKIYFYGIILAFAILSIPIYPITLLATMGISGVLVGCKDIKQEENTPTSRKINTTIVILGIITVITRASLVPEKVISGEIVLAKTKEIYVHGYRKEQFYQNQISNILFLLHR